MAALAKALRESSAQIKRLEDPVVHSQMLGDFYVEPGELAQALDELVEVLDA